MATDQETRIFLTRMIQLASKMTGSLIATVANQYLETSYVAPLLAPFMSAQLERVGLEVLDRQIAPRQKTRVARVIVITAAKIAEHLDRGKILRDDGFFEPDAVGHSQSDEVLEAALLAAMNSAEEKKIDFIALALTDISFDNKLDVASAHYLIGMAQLLSYRSFVLLKIFGEIENLHFSKRPGDEVAEPSSHLHPMMIEAFALTRLSLVVKVDKKLPKNQDVALFGWDDVDPWAMRLSPTGQLLYDTLGLKSLLQEDALYQVTIAQLRIVEKSGRGPRLDLGISFDGGLI